MSDAATTNNTQQTTSPPPSTEQQRGNEELLAEIERYRSEADRAKHEANEWKTLAVNSMPQQQAYQQPAQQQAFSYQQQVPQRPPSSLLLENPDEYDRRLEAWVNHNSQQAMQQAASWVTPQLASTGKYLSQSGQYADVWNRWSGEIERLMLGAGLLPHQQTKEAWDFIAKSVKADHVDEIAYEKAKTLANQTGFGTEGASVAGAAPTLASDPLATFWASDHQWVQRAKNTGMTLSDLRRHVAAQQVPEQQWVDETTKGRTFRSEAA